ncbi:MAG: dual specificity protein phosphatase [Actinomycetota bacterium]|nr:dual specificity protein phosphatase [Actinomycetota bacterium]MDK1026870.1 dual specificity protein phosphatase [Actinomycetota bacterium]MDK1104066.1 dual specificity protein phosphatase [Actinomycetota bacterium]
MTTYHDIAEWHRRLCQVTEQIIISGDLHEKPSRAVRQLEGWRQAGISHILDTRVEWSDKELVAEHAPNIVYGWFGADDAGLRQPDAWFDNGVEFAMDAMQEPGSVLLVHCHMGINRAPSMAYRILLECGWDPIEALDAIRESRPIADIGYARDALDHFHRTHGIVQQTRTEDRDRLEAWQRGYPMTGLHITRASDDAAPPPT